MLEKIVFHVIYIIGLLFALTPAFLVALALMHIAESHISDSKLVLAVNRIG